MVDLMLYVIKINILAIVCIFLTLGIAGIVKNRYSSMWKYYIWLLLSLFLILPVGVVGESGLIQIPTRQEKTQSIATAPQSQVNAQEIHPESNPGRSDKEVAQEGDVQQSFSPFTLEVFAQIFFFLWIWGALVLGMAVILRYVASGHTLKRWSIPLETNKYNRIFREIRAELRMKKPLRVMINTRIKTPSLSGLTKPTLYMPHTDYSQEEIRLIIRHELTHYKRKDLWYKLFLLVVNTIYWFNPFLYFMRKEAEKDIEYICDSRTIKACSRTEHSAYRQLLLKTAVNDRQGDYLSVGLNDGISDFKRRIRYMMKANKLKRGSALAVALAIFLVASNFLVGCTANNEKKQAGGNQKENTAEENVTASKEKITPEPIEETTDSSEEVEPIAQTEDQEEEEDTYDEPVADTTDDSSETSDESIPEGENTITTEYFPPDGDYKSGSALNYQRIFIEQVDPSSFNFNIWDIRNEGEDTDGENIIFETHTATFEEQNGTTAVYRGEDYTVYFDCSEYGIIQLSGLEGVVRDTRFGNNSVVEAS